MGFQHKAVSIIVVITLPNPSMKTNSATESLSPRNAESARRYFFFSSVMLCRLPVHSKSRALSTPDIPERGVSPHVTHKVAAGDTKAAFLLDNQFADRKNSLNSSVISPTASEIKAER